MTERKVYRPEEKMKIVMEGLSGTISVSDLCRKYEIKPARFYYWKDQVMNSAKDIFQNRGRKVDEDRIRAEKDDEIARLKATIAEVVQENLEIKKKIGERLQRRVTRGDTISDILPDLNTVLSCLHIMGRWTAVNVQPVDFTILLSVLYSTSLEPHFGHTVIPGEKAISMFISA